MIVSVSSNTLESLSSKTLGLLETGGAQNAKVNVITEGLLSGLDTSMALPGDSVWLGEYGELLYGFANKPYAPAHLVFIGVVTRANANNGEIFVKVQNGFELEELHDVVISFPADNEVLAYDMSTYMWKNKTAAEAGLATSTHTHSFSSITSKPTTLSGYGITDALSSTDATLTRVGGSEGGQINFQPAATSGGTTWYIDSYGAGTSPDLRVIEGAAERLRFRSGGEIAASGPVLAANTPNEYQQGNVAVTLTSGSPWSAGSATVTFPTAFTATPYIQLTPSFSGSFAAMAHVTASSATSFTVRLNYYASSTITINVRWLATLK